MSLQLTAEQVWHVIEKELFAVLGMVTTNNESRTVGIIYVAREGKLYIVSRKDAWKVRHIAQNPHVSLTVPISKHIPLIPWIKIPAATITFSGTARILDAAQASPEIMSALFRGLDSDYTVTEESCLIEVTPEKDFLTYGVGIPLMQMRYPEKARGRAPVTNNGVHSRQPVAGS